MTTVSSSSESTGPLAASSSSRGALASRAASGRLLACGVFKMRGGYFVVWLDFSFDTLQVAYRRGGFFRLLRASSPWSGSCR